MRICKGCPVQFEPHDKRQKYHERACMIRAAHRRYRRKARRAIRLMEAGK